MHSITRLWQAHVRPCPMHVCTAPEPTTFKIAGSQDSCAGMDSCRPTASRCMLRRSMQRGRLSAALLRRSRRSRRGRRRRVRPRKTPSTTRTDRGSSISTSLKRATVESAWEGPVRTYHVLPIASWRALDLGQHLTTGCCSGQPEQSCV
jgi:hypothetical protein